MIERLSLADAIRAYASCTHASPAHAACRVRLDVVREAERFALASFVAAWRKALVGAGRGRGN